MENKHSSGFAVWQHLSALYFFANSYLFNVFFLFPKTTLFNIVEK